VNDQIVENVRFEDAGIRIDRDAAVIRGVKILGLVSKNGRLYRPAALAKSMRLYEGARVNVNHPDRPPAASRSYEDRIGTIGNVQLRGDGLFGDFRFNPKHQLAEQLMWDAEHAPGNVGFSHNVTARTSYRDGKTVVEEITQVRSVDLVADPATTQGLYESHQPPLRSDELDSGTAMESPSESGPTGSQIGVREAATGTVSGTEHELHQLREENRRLRQRMGQLEAQDRSARWRQHVDRQIREASIPAALDTPVFRRQCEQATDETVLSELVEARRQDAELLIAGGRPKCVEQRGGAPGAVPDAAGFAAAIR